MPLIATERQPAPWVLDAEGIGTITEEDARRQDIRPQRVLLVDLVPERLEFTGPVTRLLANTPLQIDLTIVHLDDVGSPVSDGGVLPDSRPFRSVLDQRFDALVVSDLPGDPVVGPAWDALRDLLDWSLEHVYASLFLGGGAAAALAHFYGLNPRPLSEPLIGLHLQEVQRRHSFLLRGQDEAVLVPVRRAWTYENGDFSDLPWLEVLAGSVTSGPYLIRNRSRRQVFATNLPTHEPVHVRADLRAAGRRSDGSERSVWRAHAQVLFGNWLNSYVYQSAPYELERLVPLTLPWMGSQLASTASRS